MLTYEKAVEFLDSRQETRWELGLGRMRALLSRLGDPHRDFPAVHVAGTNGKGTFCALLAAAYQEAGYKVGLYTSPHLLRATERIQVGGEPVGEQEFADLMDLVRAADKTLPTPATYFELVTAAAFLHFSRVGADLAVVEVGLGGRLDATNVLEDPLLTVITSIGLDHTRILGSTTARIAREKAGILKAGVPCLCAVSERAAAQVIHGRAKELGAPLILGAAALQVLATHWEEGAQVLKEGSGRRIRLGLLGEAAARSAALVLQAAEVLKESGFAAPQAALARAFSRVRWPGRFQILKPSRGLLQGRTLVLDGAHNPPAMEAFLRTWKASPWSKAPAVFVLGMLKDKDWRAMLRMLGPCVRDAIVTRPASPRALDPGRLARGLPSAQVSVAQTPEAALRALARSERPVSAVAGSFYLVGRVLELLP